jgi:hypothetical protein
MESGKPMASAVLRKKLGVHREKSSGTISLNSSGSIFHPEVSGVVPEVQEYGS